MSVINGVSSFFKNLLLMLLSFMVCFALTEFALQMTSIGDYSLQDRVLFYSKPAFKRLDEEAVSYVPKTSIRSVAVYGDHIDYDTLKTTNNLGFYDSVDYEKTSQDTRDIAFIGDSFTSTSGASNPWVTQLRNRFPKGKVAFYNFGVSATGLTHFHYLLRHLMENDLVQIDELNIMAISDDFFRPIWYPLNDDEGVRLCRARVSEKECKRLRRKMFYIDSNADSEALLRRANEIYQKHDKEETKELRIYQKSRIFNLFCDVWGQNSEHNQRMFELCPHLLRYKVSASEKNMVYRESIRALIRMRQEYPDIKYKVFHLPSVQEVVKGEYALDLRREMKHINMDYVQLLKECEWSRPMFHRHDGHPNESGYEMLTECMEKFI